jgi:hypothetical protein
MYYGGEGESCYLTKAQVERRLQEWEEYTSGKIERPEWVVKKFMRDLDYQMQYECHLPGYPPKRMYDGCHKHIQGVTDMHYQMRADCRKGYEDAKAGKPFDKEYE